MAPITIDATQLSLPGFFIPGPGQIRNDIVQTVELAPGNYTFGTLFGASFAFTVTAAGVVDYDAAGLGSAVQGHGTNALTVVGFEIEIDATALAMSDFWLMDSLSGLLIQRPTTAVQSLRLIAGRYRFGTLVNPDFVFDVTAAGTIDYDEVALGGFLRGDGTTALRVGGVEIGIDATALSMSDFWLMDADSGLLVQRSATALQSLVLIPGRYRFGTLVSPAFVFDVTAAGTVEYDEAALGGFLDGAGTATLTVVGLEVAIDATTLSLGHFWLSDASSGLLVQRPTTALQSLTLIPGGYRFGTLVSPVFAFDVTAAGTVEYDEAALGGFLEGDRTATLRVVGFEIQIDATPLSMPAFWLSDSASGLLVQRPTASIDTLTLIPGRYRFGTLVSPAFVFDVTAAGTVEYDINPLGGFLTGLGSSTLRVNGYLLGIDASRLVPTTYTVNDAASGLAVSFNANRFHCMSLLPGGYQFECGFRFSFAVDDPGVFAYDPSLEPCVSGAGTQRMGVGCDPTGP